MTEKLVIKSKNIKENKEELFEIPIDILPRFAVKIFTDKRINDSAKIKFKYDFLYNYIHPFNTKYRDSVNKWYLLFTEENYIGIYKTIDEADDAIKTKKLRLCFQINSRMLSQYAKSVAPEIDKLKNVSTTSLSILFSNKYIAF